MIRGLVIQTGIWSVIGAIAAIRLYRAAAGMIQEAFRKDDSP